MGMFDLFSFDKYPKGLIFTTLGEDIFINCKENNEVNGKLQAFDSHLNVLLGDVKQKTKSIKLCQKNFKVTSKDVFNTYSFLFIRGDTISFIRSHSTVSIED